MQEVKVVARTFEVEQGVNDTVKEMNDELTLLSGKAAGVCYMPNDYMENGIQNKEKALARAEQTSKSGHHSVYDHGHITFVIKTNKMMAMILNSLGVYATSEKSARYTKMQPETELELQLYDKWRAKIKELILAKYPNIDDVEIRKRFYKEFVKTEGEKQAPPHIENGDFDYCHSELMRDILSQIKKSDTLPSAKLAQENARYMISVFTPTSMMYTISFRQIFLIIDYFDELIINCKNASDSFSKKLIKSVLELKEQLESVVGEKRLSDNKNQYIRFLEGQLVGEETQGKFKLFDDLEDRLSAKKEVIGDSYTRVYNGSLAMLAQAQRHRTLRYTMKLQEVGECGFYIPEIVVDAGLEEEWCSDIHKVDYCIPQGTIVRITEQGLFEDFALKCKERMCGRAQLEVMLSTKETLNKFIANRNELSYSNRELLKSMLTDDNKACPRCKFKDFKCSEGCMWGEKGICRLI